MIAFHTAVVEADGTLRAGASEAVVPWWSFSKTLLAAAALELAARGRVALDAPIDAHPFTLRHLLGHTAGIGDYGTLPEYQTAVANREQPWSDAQVYALVPPHRPLFAPGAGWSYSNVGYLMIRRIVERGFGAPLAEALRALVLEPLGLERAHVAGSVADMRSTVFASAHDYHPDWAFHGFVVGPVGEAALALDRLLARDRMRPMVRDAMLVRHALDFDWPPFASVGYGLGLMLPTARDADGETLQLAGHSAGGPGSAGTVFHSLKRRQTAAAFAAIDDTNIAEHEALRLLLA